MSSLHHWLVALGRGLKRDKHKRRMEEEARRVTLVLTSGEAGETWAVVAAKGAKAQKIGL